MAKRKKTSKKTKSTAKKTTKKASKKKTTKKTTKKSMIKKTTKSKSKVKAVSKKSSKKVSKRTSKVAAKKKSKIAKKVEEKRKSTRTVSKKKNYSEIDKAIMEALRADKNHLLQELQSKLELSPEEMTRAITRLENKGKIRARTVMEAGKWVCQLEFVETYGVEQGKNGQKIVWETIGDLPCFICPNIKKCNQGQEHMNPQDCENLTSWASCTMKEERYNNPFKGDNEIQNSPPIPDEP